MDIIATTSEASEPPTGRLILSEITHHTSEFSLIVNKKGVETISRITIYQPDARVVLCSYQGKSSGRQEKKCRESDLFLPCNYDFKISNDKMKRGAMLT